MWLGMVSAAAAQVPGLPLEPLNGLDALLLAYIAQVAAWCGRPSWAVVHVHLGAWRRGRRPTRRCAAIVAAIRLARHRRLAAPADRRRACLSQRAGQATARRAGRWLAAAAGAASPRRSSAPGSRRLAPADPPYGLRVEVLDVGQGDAILLQPRGRARRPRRRRPARRRAAVEARRGGRRAARRRGRHPRRVRPRRRRSRSCSASSRSTRLLYGAASPAARRRGAAPPAPARCGSRRGDVLRFGACASKCSGRRRSSLADAGAGHRPEPAGARPARPLAPLLDAAHRRRRGRGGAARPRSGRRAQGRPPRLRRRRPRRPARADPAAAGGDLGRRRQPLRPPDPGTLATLARHRVPTLRTDLAGTVEIYVRPGSAAVRSG